MFPQPRGHSDVNPFALNSVLFRFLLIFLSLLPAYGFPFILIRTLTIYHPFPQVNDYFIYYLSQSKSEVIDRSDFSWIEICAALKTDRGRLG